MSRRRGPQRFVPHVIGGLVLFPVIPWIFAGPLSDRLRGQATFHSVANLAAFLAIAACAVALVLASRLGAVEIAIGFDQLPQAAPILYCVQAVLHHPLTSAGAISIIQAIT